MTARLLRLAASCAVAGIVPIAGRAQQTEPRSRDYLFISSVEDVRAVWVNPAGLGWVPDASVMGEFVVDRANDAARIGQYTLGLNSRGLALTYERDRLAGASSIGLVRLGLGVPVGRGSLGIAGTSYGRTRDEGLDLGARYPLNSSVSLAAVLRNVGRPLVRAQRESLVGVVGATLAVAPRIAEASAEAVAVERLATSGWDLSYRMGLVLRARRPWPLAFHAAAQVGSDGSVRRWALGLVVGQRDHVGLVAGAQPASGLGAPDRFSAVGVASRRPPAR